MELRLVRQVVKALRRVEITILHQPTSAGLIKNVLRPRNRQDSRRASEATDLRPKGRDRPTILHRHVVTGCEAPEVGAPRVAE